MEHVINAVPKKRRGVASNAARAKKAKERSSYNQGHAYAADLVARGTDGKVASRRMRANIEGKGKTAQDPQYYQGMLDAFDNCTTVEFREI